MLKNIIERIKTGRTPYIIAFTVLGGIGGFLYWRFIGCNSGTCPIKSVWYYTTLYGFVIGYLAGDIISGLIFKRKKAESSDR